jgi:RNA polymerase sigma-70 factor (ECF subfamily)
MPIARTDRGSATRLEELMVLHRRLVYRVAYGFTRDGDAAMEIVQETFLKVHERLDEWRGEGEIKSWIARIAANAALNHTRTMRRQRARDLQLVPPEAGEPTQHRDLVRREAAAALERSLSTLPPRQRLAIVLRYYQGFSSREIAAVLECSEDTARNMLLRGLRKLRAALTTSAEAMP